MKKAISLLMAFVLCLSLCACGKSKAVKNAETLIDSIGEVSLDSESAIVAAENAYNSLTDEEKAKVENTEVLTAARDKYDLLLKEQAVLGTWKQIVIYPNEIAFSITFSENRLCSAVFHAGPGEETEYTFTENGVDVYGLSFELDEVAGFTVLRESNGLVLIREEDYESLFDKVFVTVDLSSADISEYAAFEHLDYTLDSFGEKEDRDTYLIVSKVYEQGLIYMWALDTIVEYGDGSTSHGGFPFGSTCDSPEFGRLTGTIIFIKSEYVDEIEFTDYERNITSKLGVGSYSQTSNIQYLDYPY